MISFAKKITAVISAAALALTAAILPENIFGLGTASSAENISAELPTGARSAQTLTLPQEELLRISDAVRADYERAGEDPDATVSPITGYDHSCSFYYDRLTAPQKQLWDDMTEVCDRLLVSSADLTQYYTFPNGFMMFYFTDAISYSSSEISDDEVKAIYNLFRDTNPQYYFLYSYITSYMSATGQSADNYLLLSAFGDCATSGKRKAYQQAITAVTNEWLPEIEAETTVLAKELLICDLIKDYIEYDNAALTAVPGDWHDQGLVGVFFDRSAVCAGYAHAVTYLCNAVGIPCVDMIYEGVHEWNRVSLYGIWYETDVTWYDTGEDAQWLNRSHSAISDMDENGYHNFTTTYYSTLGVSCPPASTDTVYGVKSISVSELPAKTVYGVGETLDLTGGKVTAQLTNGGTYTTEMTAGMVTGFSSSAAGTKTLTVKFDGKTATFDVTVERAVSGIAIATLPKTEYIVGETLDVTGGELTVSYDDNSSENVPITADMISGFDTSEAGTFTLTVTYMDFTAQYDITVSTGVITEIALKTAPKTVYYTGESLDVAGGVLAVTYSTGFIKEVELSAGMVSGFTTEAVGKYTVTVQYLTFTCTYEITVKEDTVESIDIMSGFKTIYQTGDSLDVTDSKLKITYASGKTDEAAITEEMVSGFTTEAAGEYTVTVTYLGKTDTCRISVADAPVVTGIVISKLPRTTYLLNDKLELKGGRITAEYSDGTFETVDMTAEMVSGFTTETVGKHTVTVTYEDCKAEYEITVTSAALLVNGEPCEDFAAKLKELKKTEDAITIEVNKSLAVPVKLTFPTKAKSITIKGASRSINLDLDKTTSLSFSCPVEIDSIVINNNKHLPIQITAKKSITLTNATVGVVKASDNATVTNGSTVTGNFSCSAKAGKITFDTAVVAGNLSVTGKSSVSQISDTVVTGNAAFTGHVGILGTLSVNGVFTPKSSLELDGEIKAGSWD